MNAEALRGSWTLVSWTRKCVEDNSVSYPFGKNPEGKLQLEDGKLLTTAKKDVNSMSSVPTIEDGLSNPEVTEFSFSGTYQIRGNELHTVYEECSDKSKIGKEKVATIWFDGHTTLVMRAQKPIEINGKHYVPSATWIKDI